MPYSDSVPPEDLAHIFASAKHYLDGGIAPTGSFQKHVAESQRKPLDAEYLFTMESADPHGLEWDVIELGNAATVSQFTPGGHLTRSDLGLPKTPPQDRRFQGHAPDPPHLRYLLLVPNQPGSEVRRALGEPHIDHYLVTAMVLTGDNAYRPVGAVHVGQAPGNAHRQTYPDLLRRISSILDEDYEPQKKAPDLGHEGSQWTRALIEREIRGNDQNAAIQALLTLDDLPFLEAISRIGPHLHRLNSWLNTAPAVATRLATVKASMKLKGRIRKSPWKDAWMLPALFDPKIRFASSPHIRQSDPIRTKRKNLS